MTSEVIVTVVKLIVLLLTAVLGRYVIPFVREKVNFVYLSEAAAWAETFVKSAEMIITGEKMGEEKMEKATEWMEKKLGELGIVMSDEQIRSILEEAVYNMNNNQGN